MTIPRVQFHANLLQSDSLKKIFKTDTAIKQIRAELATFSVQPYRKQARFKIETAVFAYECAALAWSILSILCFFARSLTNRCTVLSYHARSQASIVRCTQVFREHFLCPSINTYRKENRDLYLHSPINSPLLGPYNLFNPHGLCRGMCNWFYHLYFQTKSSSNNPIEHLKVLTRQFSQGAPFEAALLHLLKVADSPEINYLKLEIKEDYKSLQLDEEIAEEFWKLPQGEYTVISSTHQFNFIKVDDKLCFLYDPNLGTFAIRDKSMCEKLVKKSLANHNRRCKILIDHIKHKK